MTMTSKSRFSWLVAGCTAVLLAACGGGGGGGDGTTPATITKEATLTLGQEVPAATPPAPPATNPIGGTMTVTLTTGNALSGILTLTGDFTRVTAAHIHDGDVGNAPANNVVIALLNDGNGSWSLPATASLTAAQAARFKAGGYYVNAHTAANPAGEIRGQLIGFADNIQPLFTANCAVSTWHVAGSSTGAPMSLAAGVSVTNLVGQVASGSAGTRVIAGDSANSVLYKRITGTTAGAQMPSGRPLLPENERNLIKVWIDMGAQNN
jgi:hypothetical protein